VRLRPPRRDDPPFVIVFIRINHRNFQAVHQANRIDSAFTVVETVIDFLDRWPIENPHRMLEGDPMSDNIAAVLLYPDFSANCIYTMSIWAGQLDRSGNLNTGQAYRRLEKPPGEFQSAPVTTTLSAECPRGKRS